MSCRPYGTLDRNTTGPSAEPPQQSNTGIAGDPGRAGLTNIAPTALGQIGWCGGFYKRGCQEKTLPRQPDSVKFSDIQPLSAATMLLATRCWEQGVVGVHAAIRTQFPFIERGFLSSWFDGKSLANPVHTTSWFGATLARQQAGRLSWQPWFYLRLAQRGTAYSFLGLSEGAYGGPGDSAW